MAPGSPRKSNKVRKKLTALGIENLKPTKSRQEIRDNTSPLLLIIQAKPSGAKSFAMRFRRPGGKPAKLTLGPFVASAKETADPVIGQPLTLASARLLAAEIDRKRALKLDVVGEHRVAKLSRHSVAAKDSASTFTSEARRFVESYRIEKRGPREGMRPRGWRENARVLGIDYPNDGGEPTIIKGSLADRWRDTPVSAITKDIILDLIEETEQGGIPGLQARNAGSSVARSRHLAAALGSLFKWLDDKRKISVNPFIGMRRPKRSVKRNRVLNFRADVRRGDELRWFWKACDEIGGPFGAATKLLLLTGCRRDEIAMMTSDELNADFTMLRLPGERTKNGLPHDVPLSPLCREIIDAVPRVSNQFIFSTGKKPISGFNKIKKRLDALMMAEALKERGEFKPWRIHDLRRTFSTGMAEIGVMPHVVEACLNHAKPGIEGTYNLAAYLKEKKDALKKWAAYVRRIVEAKKQVVKGRDANVISASIWQVTT